VKYSNIIARKKVFLNERCLEPTTAPLVTTKELKRRALAITTVGSLNKSCGLKFPYKDSIAIGVKNDKHLNKSFLSLFFF
jgi:hypothetical protein